MFEENVFRTLPFLILLIFYSIHLQPNIIQVLILVDPRKFYTTPKDSLREVLGLIDSLVHVQNDKGI